MIGIYKITNPKGKVYIGQSWNIQERFNQYKKLHCKRQRKLYNSFLKYGIENHKFEIIHELPNDIEQCILDTYEILYIAQYRECGVELLNLKEGGCQGGKCSDETKQKLKESGKKRKDLEILKKRMKNRIISEETLKKMSDSQKGRIISLDSIKKGIETKIRNGTTGKGIKKQTKESKEKIRQSRKIPISQFTKDGIWIKNWDSSEDASTNLKIQRTSITDCCRKYRSKTAGGFIWQYN